MKNYNVTIVATANTMKGFPLALKKIGLDNAKSLKLFINFASNVYLNNSGLAGTVQQRANSFLNVCNNQDTEIIWSLFGGESSHQLIPHFLSKVDDLHLNLNKPIIGFSDFTSILLFLYDQKFLNLYHGPSFSTFCDPDLDMITKRYFIETVIENNSYIIYTDPGFYASDLWYFKPDYGPREYHYNKPWISYNPGISYGPIIGGNLETLHKLIEINHLVDITGHILFIEDTTGNNIEQFYTFLKILKTIGVFKKIKGLILGMFPSGSILSQENIIFQQLDALELKQYKIPILLNFHCSHVTPMFTIPLGHMTKLTCGRQNKLEIWR